MTGTRPDGTLGSRLVALLKVQGLLRPPAGHCSSFVSLGLPLEGYGYAGFPLLIVRCSRICMRVHLEIDFGGHYPLPLFEVGILTTQCCTNMQDMI